MNRTPRVSIYGWSRTTTMEEGVAELWYRSEDVMGTKVSASMARRCAADILPQIIKDHADLHEVLRELNFPMSNAYNTNFLTRKDFSTSQWHLEILYCMLRSLVKSVRLSVAH